jgi:hypothetical protein
MTNGYNYSGMNRMPIIIDINGFEVQLFEKMYNYICNAYFSNYSDEEVDALAIAEDNSEACFPSVL